MLVILRVILGAALVGSVSQAISTSDRQLETGDMTSPFWLSVSVLLGIANATVWAPFFAERLADPLTGTFVRGTYVERWNVLVKLTRWLNERGFRRLTLLFAFLEGVHRPKMPSAFVIGLQNARPGSWLEKVFAREVFRFSNTKNCVWAYEILRRHGVDPGMHPHPEIHLVIRSLERSVEPLGEPVPLPPAGPAIPQKRDPNIKLFDGADGERPRNQES